MPIKIQSDLPAKEILENENIFVMDETHTILGCGAGAVTKLKKPLSESLERIFNYKYPYEYINGFDEMLSRKERVKSFYDELAEYLSQICLWYSPH